MLLRYTASADNTIVSAYQSDLRTRATGANAGQADIVEIFSIYGRQSTSSQGLSRCLVKFPVDKLITDRSSGKLPSSGEVNFYLQLYNAPTSRTVPIEYKLCAHRVTEEWEEGVGLDLEGYTDLVKGQLGSDWIQNKKGATWSTVGGAYSLTTDEWFEQSFSTGLEDMKVDVTSLVEKWIAGTADNYGMIVKLSGSYEASSSQAYVDLDPNVILNTTGAQKSYYTKRFFARGSQYFYKRPTLEARWDDVIRDDRSNFHYSSSRAPAADNLNTLYFYNVIGGRLVNIPAVGTGEILVSLYSGSSDDSAPSGSELVLYDGNLNITGGYVSTGIYSCSVAITSAATPLETLYDVWHSSSVEYYTGSLSPKTISTGNTTSETVYYLNLKNLKEFYSNKEVIRLNLYSRNKNWQPTIYTVANNTPELVPILSASYRVYRLVDGYEVIPYDTSSADSTGLSYDVNGNYFKFDMSLLEPGFAYGFQFAIYDNIRKSWQEQDQVFKLKVAEF